MGEAMFGEDNDWDADEWTDSDKKEIFDWVKDIFSGCSINACH
jgi:hypothetical protein